MTRRFHLLRHVDVSGVSGTGVVADGVLWPDGAATIRWRGEHPSTVHWDRGQASVEHIHGHGGATEVVWVDEEPPLDPAARQAKGWSESETLARIAGIHTQEHLHGTSVVSGYCCACGNVWPCRTYRWATGAGTEA